MYFAVPSGPLQLKRQRLAGKLFYQWAEVSLSFTSISTLSDIYLNRNLQISLIHLRIQSNYIQIFIA